jgi:hypothetical protein
MVELPLVVEEGLVTKSGHSPQQHSYGRSFAFAGLCPFGIGDSFWTGVHPWHATLVSLGLRRGGHQYSSTFLPNVFQLITARVGAQLNMAISLSGTATGQTTLLAQLYNIPIDVSSVPNGWL